MWDYIIAGIVGLVVGTTIAYVAYNWERLSAKVQVWLSKRKLGKGALTAAFCVVDFVVVGVRRLLRVRTLVQTKTSTGTEMVDEEVVSEGAEANEQLMKELNGRSSLSKDLMPMLT